VLGVKIGKGAYAQVRVAIRNDSTVSQSIDIEEMPRETAVKIVDLEPKTQDVTHQMLKRISNNEVDIWNSVGCHNHCVRLYETFFDARACYMVMEKCESSLLGHLECMLELNERTLGGLFVQMLKGIEHVHSLNVVHRDVKPDNFLIGGDNVSVVKLADFGLARKLPETGKLHGVFGTAPFMAPEMLQQLPYGQKIDVWSLGVVAYTLLFGSFPYLPINRSSAAMKDAILDGFEPSFRQWNGVLRSQKCSDSTTAFVQDVLTRDPKARPTASEALKLPFMVAVMEDNHMLGIDLASLRVTVQQAKKAGAFENRDLCKECQLDNYLNEMHLSKHILRLPLSFHAAEFAPDDLCEGTATDLAAGVVHLKHEGKSGAVETVETLPPIDEAFEASETSDASSCGTIEVDITTTNKASTTTSSQNTQMSVQPSRLMAVAKWLETAVTTCQDTKNPHAAVPFGRTSI
jgi:serine/threonine protein kinase